MNHLEHAELDHPIDLRPGPAGGRIVVVCEHASAHIPPAFDTLGVSAEAGESHAAWDPGALAVAERLAEILGATLVAATVSRLVYDCNRPPDAPDAMPAQSEIVDVPGNVGLSAAARADRAARYYAPFRDTLARVLAGVPEPVLVTIHSFTPVYHGVPREVEIGILHDRDTRLADAILRKATAEARHRVVRNAPYGPQDGVTHTLRAHALPGGHLNVMIELRNDLITTPDAQAKMATHLAEWLRAAIAEIEAQSCTA